MWLSTDFERFEKLEQQCIPHCDVSSYSEGVRFIKSNLLKSPEDSGGAGSSQRGSSGQVPRQKRACGVLPYWGWEG